MPDTDLKTRLLKAAKPHVPFDGWSETTLRLAAEEEGIDRAMVDAVFPRGAVDLALAYHEAGDAAMVETLEKADLGAMRFRDRVAFAVRTRLDLVEDRELVRRGMTLFALPPHAGDGTRALWRTADHIWRLAGDTATDFNHYTKRATLAAVYGSTLLAWLGDESEGDSDTAAFLDRRIDDVMRFEHFKARWNGDSDRRPSLTRFLGRLRYPPR